MKSVRSHQPKKPVFRVSRKGPSKYQPQKIDMEAVEKSPVFTNPKQWISNFYMIAESERIQSYKPLSQSCIAQLLSSPPRMVHASRTVVPRDFLIPLKLIQNPMGNAAASADAKNRQNFKYIIGPYHPNERKLPEDPVTYYPRSLSAFRDYAAGSDHSQQATVPLQKYSINLGLYPEITSPKLIGWNVNTHKVVEKIQFECLANQLGCTVISENDSAPRVTIDYTDSAHDSRLLSISDHTVVLNVSALVRHNPAVKTLLEKYTPFNYIPIQEETIPAIKSLIAYALFVDQ